MALGGVRLENQHRHRSIRRCRVTDPVACPHQPGLEPTEHPWPWIALADAGRCLTDVTSIYFVCLNIFPGRTRNAFSPSRMVPGIEPSEDRMLQGRMFSHTDTQMYRLGANFNQSSINRPRVRVTNNNQDGALNFGDRNGEVNYESSTLNELAQNPRDKSEQRCRSPRCSAASTCCRDSSHMARTRITSMRSVVPRYRTRSCKATTPRLPRSKRLAPHRVRM